MKRFLGAAIFAVFWLLHSCGTAEALIIDSFDTSLEAADGVANATPVEADTNSGDMIGGVRKFIVNKTAGIGTVRLRSNDGGGGLMEFDQSSTSTGTGLVIYDGNADSVVDTMGLASVDLTEGGALNTLVFHSFFLTFPSAGTFNLTITLYDDTTGDDTSVTKTFTTGFTGALSIDFGEFDAPSYASNLGAMTILFDGTSAPGADVLFDFFETAPEPSSLALMGLGALSLAGYRLRRRRRNVA